MLYMGSACVIPSTKCLKMLALNSKIGNIFVHMLETNYETFILYMVVGGTGALVPSILRNTEMGVPVEMETYIYI